MKPTEPPAPDGPVHKMPSPDAPGGARPPVRRPGVHGGYPIRAGSAIPYDDGVAHHQHEEDDPLHNPEVAHEHSDVDIRAIVASGIILVVVVVVSQLLMWLLFGWFEREAAANEPQLTPVARPATTMPQTTTGSPFFNEAVAGPQLLTNEPRALERHRAEEAKRLEGYGWVDQNTGVAHMPIEEAKKLILQRGLPVRQEGVVPPALGTRAPTGGEASGGRALTQELPAPPTGTPGAPAAPGPSAPKPDGKH